MRRKLGVPLLPRWVRALLLVTFVVVGVIFPRTIYNLIASLPVFNPSYYEPKDLDREEYLRQKMKDQLKAEQQSG